ncbi:MAG: hypothetical protein JO302_00135 [Candidatus Eremiobacteraeota bacterium]|nr:hypothetical protein [Candidatus Eremiobacteraeota bacterium]
MWTTLWRSDALDVFLKQTKARYSAAFMLVKGSLGLRKTRDFTRKNRPFEAVDKWIKKAFFSAGYTLWRANVWASTGDPMTARAAENAAQKSIKDGATEWR